MNPAGEKKRATILIVDDEPANLKVLSLVLEQEYRVRAARNGEQAIATIQTDPRPDLVLLDIMMPGMDGYAVLARINELGLGHIPVIFITALGDEIDEVHGLKLGAVDYIGKPIRVPIVRARVKTQLELKAARDHLERQVESRTQELHRVNRELHQSYIETVRSFSLLLENRDPALAGHSRRVADSARRIARKLRLPDKQVNDIVFAGLLSRIGTITLSRKILSKPMMALSKVERDELMISTIGAKEILQNISMLHDAAQVIAGQFERYNGSGFPNRLKGEAIPVGARILAVARDFDLLLEGMLDSRKHLVPSAKAYLHGKIGVYYDPQIVDIHNHMVGWPIKHARPLVEVGLVDLVEGMEVAEVKFGDEIFLRDVIVTREIIRELEQILLETGIYCAIKVRARI